jgi:predicted metal-binding membrane protein
MTAMHADTAQAARIDESILTAAARRGLRSPIFRWSIAPALAAWSLLFVLAAQDRTLTLCLAPRATLLGGALAEIEARLAAIDPTRWTGEWTLMIVAMMFPLLVPAIGHVGTRSYAFRRERSVALFVAGYALTWAAAVTMASGALVVALSGLAVSGLATWGGLIGCALAALWQISAAKERAVNRCHGTVPLRPAGFAADQDAIRFGLLHGIRCVGACLPTMVLPLLGSHGVGAMAVIFAILLAERARQAPQYGLSAVVLLLLGLTTLMQPTFG